MKGLQHPKNDVSLNASGNESIHDVIAKVDVSRRQFVRGVQEPVFGSIGKQIMDFENALTGAAVIRNH